MLQNAIRNKFQDKSKDKHKKLLDYSIDEYGEELVNDIRCLGGILVLYLPLPLFWTLFDQRGTTWTFQANKMNGNMGSLTIEPDQMILLNPLLCLFLLPLFESVIYPILSKIGVRRPLQRITVGGILAGVSFLCASIVQFQIDSSPPHTINMLWQFPQYLILTIGEIMFVPTGLAFSYQQAPDRMKSVVQAFWHLTNAVGDLITIIIFVAELNTFESVAYEFILFGCIMIVDMVIFAILSYYYKNKAQIK